MKRRITAIGEHLQNWECARPHRRGKAYVIAYTMVFALIALVSLLVYPLNGREIIWSVDGLEQYYPFFVYEGQYFREIIANLVAGGGLQIPLWEWSSGYGVDVITTFDVFFDPLNLTSVLCPESLSEYLFQFLIIVRLWLAGLAFSWHSLYRGNGRYATLMGAVLYALCGSALVVLRWTSGISALILFPCLLVGAEKVLARERPWCFILFATLFLIVSYYFSYMAFLFLAGYCAVRVFAIEKPMTLRLFMGHVGRVLGYLLVAFLLAAIVLVPAVIALLSCNRVVDQSTMVSLLYPFAYYETAIVGFLSIGEVGSDTLIGFGGLAYLSCLLLFSVRKGNMQLKALFIILTAFLLIPAVGSVLNGFNYATNRWAWVYALCVCYIVVRMVPALMQPTQSQKRILLVGTGLFALLFVFSNIRTEANAAAYAALMVAVVIVIYTDISMRRRRYYLLAVLALGIAVNAFYYVSPGEGGIGSKALPLGSAYDKLTSSSCDKPILAVDDDSTWRYDSTPVKLGRNSFNHRLRNNPLVLGKNAINFYCSIYNSNIDKYHTELAVAGDDINFSYLGLDGRAILDTLASVKYYVLLDDGHDLAPYNYRAAADLVHEEGVNGLNYKVYCGADTLPIGFTTKRWISRTSYEALTPIKRQEALLQGVVVEDSTLTELDASSLEFTSSEIPFTVANTHGCTYEDGEVRATSSGAVLTLDVNGLPASETYVYLSNLHYTALEPSELVSKKEYESMKWYYKANLLKKDLEHKASNDYTINFSADKGSSVHQIHNYVSTYHMYGGKDTWLVNLGYANKGQQRITITFANEGRYTFDGLQVLCQPFANFQAQVNTYKTDVLEGFYRGCNRFGGTLDLEEKKLLYVSVPYSTGWTARVDGTEAAVMQANTAFMALELEPGHHEVEFSYCTPGLKEGAALSLIGLIALCGIIVRYRLRRHA